MEIMERLPCTQVLLPPGEEVLKRNLGREGGRGGRPTQRNSDPIQDPKENFAALSMRKCCNSFTLFKTGSSISVFNAMRTVYKFTLLTRREENA